MTEQQAKLLNVVRNAKNPEQAIITAAAIIAAFLKEEKEHKENA